MRASKKWIDRLLTEHRLSVRRAAARLDVSPSAVSNWHRGAGGMTPEHACRIARELGVDAVQIVVEVSEEAARSDDERATWGRLRKAASGFGHAVTGVCVAALQFIHYAKSLRRPATGSPHGLGVLAALRIA